MDEFVIKPIGIFRTSKRQPMEAARQATADHSNSTAYILLNPKQQFEQALEDLKGFSHIWVIYQFHKNSQWKPKVLPPRGSSRKVGVFATRSPYRPNPLGLSCLEIKKIAGLKVFVGHHDLLDGSPILDIKPYLPESDSFPKARQGWLRGIEKKKVAVSFSAKAKRQLNFLSDPYPEIVATLIHQLEFEPTNGRKKRVKKNKGSGKYIFSYRTWRVHFSLAGKKLRVDEIMTGYSQKELQNPADPYQDKKIHLQFQKNFKLSLRD